MAGLIASAQTQQGYVKTKGRMIGGKYYEGKRIGNVTVRVRRTAPLSGVAQMVLFRFLCRARSMVYSRFRKKGMCCTIKMCCIVNMITRPIRWFYTKISLLS